MKITTGKHFSGFIYMCFIILLLSTGCVKRLSKVVKPSDLPPDMATTELLVREFEYQDPKIYDSFAVINTDSLQATTGFKFQPENTQTEKDKKRAEKEEKKLDQAREKEHPLIVKTNANLDAYNKKLERAMKVSKYPYQIVKKAEIDSGTQFQDLTKHRYILERRPELHCYQDPNGVTQLSYRYVHRFYDRQTKKYFTDIEIFSPKPWRTAKAIIVAANKNLRR